MSALSVYRAWHKQERKMLDVIEMQFSSEVVFFNTLLSDGETNWALLRDIELLAYTGYKDKHGKRIFEGDLVRVNGYDEVFQVVWGMFRDCCVEGETWVLSPQIYQTTVWYHAQCKDDDDEWLEVVGNIYENPELNKTQVR